MLRDEPDFRPMAQPLVSIPSPWRRPAFAKKRSLGYKVNGSAEMTDKSLVRACGVVGAVR